MVKVHTEGVVRCSNSLCGRVVRRGGGECGGCRGEVASLTRLLGEMCGEEEELVLHRLHRPVEEVGQEQVGEQVEEQVEEEGLFLRKPPVRQQ